MSTREIMLFNMFGRETPPSVIGDWLESVEATGLVDYYGVYDNLVAWMPAQLWREFTPNAELVPDIDSYYDPAFLLGLAAGRTNSLGLGMNATNAVRNGPAEVYRLALSLANARPGKSMLGIGAGEAYNIRPFGYDRSKGLRRLEDHLRLYQRLQTCDGPFDFDGNEITYRQAYIGTIRPHEPSIWTIGAGPKLLDLTTTYADGNTGVAPYAWPTAERFAEFVQATKRELERKGRDPEAFGFGLEFGVLLNDDWNLIEQALEHPLIKLFTAVYGRFGQARWEDEGFTPVMPADWKYHLHWQPNLPSRDDLLRVIDAVTPGMVEATFEAYSGSVDRVASTIEEYYQAGMTMACIADLLPGFLPLDPGSNPMAPTLDLCARLKTTPAP